jgi:hypothetical protein
MDVLSWLCECDIDFCGIYLCLSEVCLVMMLVVLLHYVSGDFGGNVGGVEKMM